MIIGVVGPVCAGKDTFLSLFKELDFEHVSMGDILRAEMKEKGIEITRENIQKYVTELRQKEGFSAVAKRVRKVVEPGRKYIVQGFRNPEEVIEMKNSGNFFLVNLDAPAEKRFLRMKERAREKDPATFEDFLRIDNLELGDGTLAGFNIRGCMEIADCTIINDGDVEELRKKVDGLVSCLGEQLSQPFEKP
jgi:dephospho-CoA kinase